jgi:CubicO group peptidase (beta-lactamase class C family)
MALLSRRSFLGTLAAGAALAASRPLQAAPLLPAQPPSTSPALPLDLDFSLLAARLREAARSYRVPGAAVGVVSGNREWAQGVGVVNLDAPLALDEQAILPVGPLTMVFTATALLRLVEQGRLHLDTPVRAYIQGFRVADEQVSREVTLLDCLTHLAGWWGDDLTDTGSGEDALTRYVAEMTGLPQTVPYGAFWSFNPAAYCVAGRILEIVTGRSYEEAIRTLVFDPLGLQRAFFNAVEVLTLPVSVGHQDSGDQLQVVRPFGVPRALNPALGALLSLRDLLRFAAFHLGSSASLRGLPVLSLPFLAYARTPRTGPGSAFWLLLDGFGLGWMLWSLRASRFAGLLGETPDGQQLALLLYPERDFALVLFGNSPSAAALIRDLIGWVMSDVIGLPLSPPTLVDLPPEQIAAYVGQYEVAPLPGRTILTPRHEVVLRDGALFVRGADGALSRLRFFQPDRALAVDGPLAGTYSDFLRDRSGTVRWHRLNLRALPRTRPTT